jgi:hypothetical protein
LEGKVIDNLFKNGFENARVAPTQQVWERIEAALAEKRRRRKLLWFRWSAAASVVLVTGSLALILGRDGTMSSTPNATLAIAGHRSLAQPVRMRISTGAPQNGGEQQATPFVLPSEVQSPSLSPAVISPPQMVVAEPFLLLASMEAPFSPSFQPPVIPLVEEEQMLFAEAEQPRKQRKEKHYEFSSEEPLRASRENRWTLGGTYSPDLSLTSAALPGSTIARSSSKAAAVTDAAPVQNNHLASFTSGVRFAYGVSKHVDLQSGFLYNNRRGVSDQAGVFSTADNVRQAAVVETNHLYQAFEVPLAMKVSLKPESKVNPYITTGLSGNFFYKYRAAAQTESDLVNYKQVNNVVPNRLIPSQLNLTLGTGLQYQIGNQVSMNLEPGLRYGVVTTEYSFTRIRPLTAGINAGVNLHF